MFFFLVFTIFVDSWPRKPKKPLSWRVPNNRAEKRGFFQSRKSRDLPEESNTRDPFVAFTTLKLQITTHRATHLASFFRIEAKCVALISQFVREK